MSTTWTDADNLSAFEAATITHVNRIEALELQVKRLKEALRETGPTMDYFMRRRIIDDAIGMPDPPSAVDRDKKEGA